MTCLVSSTTKGAKRKRISYLNLKAGGKESKLKASSTSLILFDTRPMVLQLKVKDHRRQELRRNERHTDMKEEFNPDTGPGESELIE